MGTFPVEAELNKVRDIVLFSSYYYTKVSSL